MINFDISKSLQELDGQDWGEPDYFPSYVVKTVHYGRRKPLQDLTNEELRLIIGQGLSLEYLIPIAFERLVSDPFLAGDFGRGDLLQQVLRVKQEFWDTHTDLYCDLDMLVLDVKFILEKVVPLVDAYKSILDRDEEDA